jgi:hypothetical protein
VRTDFQIGIKTEKHGILGTQTKTWNIGDKDRQKHGILGTKTDKNVE